VLNGSPLFTGGAGSGESEIRRYVLENDLVEAIIGLPTDMFYNTGISTYVWICQQPQARRPQGQGAAHRRQRLLAEDAQEPGQQAQGTQPRAHRRHHPPVRRVQGGHPDGVPISRIFKNEDFGYRTITVERPERDEKGKVVLGTEGQGQGQAGARQQPARHRERAAQRGRGDLLQARGAAPCAGCVDRPEKTKVGYEIPFNRHFYVFKPPRPLAEIDAELKGVTDRILTMIGGLTFFKTGTSTRFSFRSVKVARSLDAGVSRRSSSRISCSQCRTLRSRPRSQPSLIMRSPRSTHW
jgi:type I restriction enzyme M protein